MGEKERYSDWHRYSISKNLRRPIFKRILLLLVYVLISFVVFFVGSQDEWKHGELILVLFPWLFLIPDLVADVHQAFLAISYHSLLYLLYLAALCRVTTFFLRTCKSSRVGKIAALVVPIAIQLSGVGFLILGYNRVLSPQINKQLLCSLLALGLVLAYRTFDWCLAQNVERKR